MTYTLPFGKYKGMTIEEVYATDASYVSWLADRSYVAPARRAAAAVIAAAARKDAAVSEQLLKDLRHIVRAAPHPHLREQYKYLHFDVRRDYACIELCTHHIFTPGGFLDDWGVEDWDIIQISTYHEGLDEIDEEEDYIYGHELPPSKARKTGPAPTAEAAIWYAMRDNSQRNPLNDTPVTLAEAVALLEQYLATK